MLVIGLTGGIGSGKSTVARLFEKKGITIVDTDQLARDLTAPRQNAFDQIVEKFGKTILLSDGTLNRALLRKLIFADPIKRHWLEELLHPLIREETARLVAATLSPYCILVIPLLFETKTNFPINRILVVDATKEQQITRAKMRDQLSEKEIQAIIDTQVTREERLEKADDVILNDGELAHLTAQVDRLHAAYLQIASSLTRKA